MQTALIALDLDGTALRPDHLTISPRLEKTLEKAHDRGILIVPVTGRPYGLLPPFLKAHPLWESYAILCNGAEERDMKTGLVTAHAPLEEKHIRLVLEAAREFDIPAELNAGGKLYLTQKTLEHERREPKLLFHCTVFLKEHGIFVPDLENLSELSVEKIHLNCIPEEKWDQVLSALSEIPVSVVCEKPPNLEVTHRTATKGQGLTRLCSRLSIPMDQVMAIGDSGNDLSMLESVGLPVAMATAPERIRRAAAYVTGSNLQDGAAEAICRFAL